MDETISDRELRAEIVARFGREALAQAVKEIRELARSAEEGHREQMLSGYNTVRRFLPLLLGLPVVTEQERTLSRLAELA